MTSNAKKCLSEIESTNVATFLLERYNDKELQHGAINEAAAKWNVNRNTISVIWKRARISLIEGSLNVKSKRFGNTNRKRILPNIEHIKTLKFSERSTIQRLSKKVKVSVGTVHSWVTTGLLKPHSSPLHPTLNDLNKVNRVKFTLNSLDVYQTVENIDKSAPTIQFKDMTNIIHIDEKWFYLSRVNQRYYVVDGEDLPHRTCQSKRHMIKVMFICAVSRPIYGDEGELLFDGKIGMFPFTFRQPAQRSSKNRAAGTLETKAIDSITKQVTKQCLIEKIIPAIKAKWPATRSKRIYIQQDNATPHITNNDADFRSVATSDGFDIQLVFQPPNSPDLNINDLGFFRAIQSLQSKVTASNVEELVGAVEKAFTDYSPTKINKIFLTLQSVMIEILKANGHNNFSIPHMKKDHLQVQGLLPNNLLVDASLVKQCIDMLLQKGQADGLEKIMEDLGYSLES